MIRFAMSSLCFLPIPGPAKVFQLWINHSIYPAGQNKLCSPPMASGVRLSEDDSGTDARTQRRKNRD
jgi:hypothetical protein